MRPRLRAALVSAIIMVAGGQSQAATLNAFVVDAANNMVRDVAGRGYDRRSSFTEALSYGQVMLRPSNLQGQTMCVAAVAEAMIRAIQLHSRVAGTTQAFEKLPATHWTKGSLNSLRAHLYQMEGANSRGPGDALSRFGMGEVVSFEALVPGDFLAFSRKKSGHAVVFLGFLDNAGNIVPNYVEKRVVGFRYMSSQGEGLPVSGVGFRNAFFAGISGPRKCNREYEDCGVLRRPSDYLNGGRLWAPAQWDTAAALSRLRQKFLNDAMRSNPTVTKGAAEIAVDQLLDRDLPERYSVQFE